VKGESRRWRRRCVFGALDARRGPHFSHSAHGAMRRRCEPPPVGLQPIVLHRNATGFEFFFFLRGHCV
jgi:hypothetical protein